ncbi:1-phosphatidylinositol 4,5-bisphosphate phosphodiesterase eta-2 [Liparis tanakae]|uniref:1-phosphatidylinositol 4,5-bisphosphate phosphodiesterase eta-2 n=1 Tax=Liparis tanakae TaxID=230148 RepID=A0A4Z2G173_9TELE|nr:1-phosphatidylinositol 4,5-bisphosphate phosphodiesterase eta-2 [Liparis tanakae]
MDASRKKKSGFFPLGSATSAPMCSTGDKPGPPAEAVGRKSRRPAFLSHAVDELLCIGGSVVAFSKWRLGYVVEKCMSSMQMGTQMVKLRGGSKGLVRFFFLDEHKSCIRWRPSRKNEKAKISVDSVREVREGKQSEIFQRYSEGSFDPNCCFSLYYGEHMESLDLVSGNGEEARTWITGLKYLMAGISDEDSLAKRQRTRDQYPSLVRPG